MSGHDYEYKTTTEYVSMWAIENEPTLDEPLIRQRLAEVLNGYYFKLPAIIDGMDDSDGWEVISHSISIPNNWVLISTLLRRSRT